MCSDSSPLTPSEATTTGASATRSLHTRLARRFPFFNTLTLMTAFPRLLAVTVPLDTVATEGLLDFQTRETPFGRPYTRSRSFCFSVRTSLVRLHFTADFVCKAFCGRQASRNSRLTKISRRLQHFFFPLIKTLPSIIEIMRASSRKPWFLQGSGPCSKPEICKVLHNFIIHERESIFQCLLLLF